MDKRTAKWNTLSGLMRDESEHDNVTPEYRWDPRCHICSAPDKDIPNGSVIRNLVDDLLLVPKPYAAILRLIEPLMESWPAEARISRDGLRRHGTRHLAWDEAGVRKIAERRAGKVDEAAERMLKAETVLEVIRQRGFDAVVSGETTPSVKDTMAATAALREIERETEGEFSVAHALAQLDRHIQVMREIVPVEYHEAILARLDDGAGVLPSLPSADPTWDGIVDEMGDDALK